MIRNRVKGGSFLMVQEQAKSQGEGPEKQIVSKEVSAAISGVVVT